MEKYDWLRISELLFRKRTGLISPSEQFELDEWLSESERHRLLYKRILSGESLGNSRRFIDMLDKTTAVNRIHIEIKRHRRRKNIMRIGSVAAVAAIVALLIIIRSNRETFSGMLNSDMMANNIMLSIADERQIILDSSDIGDEWIEHVKEDMINRSENDSGSDTEYDTVIIKIIVPRGKEYRLLLPDGSSVWLNSESVIEYPSMFSKEKREVALTGEAYFDIFPDSSAPFEIITHDQLKITVLGTQFNVRSYSDLEETYVTLVEGAVLVAHDGGEFVLSPNQQAVYNHESNDLYAADINDATIYCAWTRGMFNFENERIEVILQAMEKWYNIKFVSEYIDLDSLGHFTLSVPRNDDFSHVIDVLRKITGLKCTIKKETVYLSY